MGLQNQTPDSSTPSVGLEGWITWYLKHCTSNIRTVRTLRNVRADWTVENKRMIYDQGSILWLFVTSFKVLFLKALSGSLTLVTYLQWTTTGLCSGPTRSLNALTNRTSVCGGLGTPKSGHVVKWKWRITREVSPWVIRKYCFALVYYKYWQPCLLRQPFFHKYWML